MGDDAPLSWAPPRPSASDGSSPSPPPPGLRFPPGLPIPGAPRPQHAVPAQSHEPPVAPPTSSFSAYSRFQPRCGHLMMTRVYDLNFRCERCNRHGSFGWLYRCTEHREPLIEDINRLGFKTAFDPIGEHFAGQMSLGKHGPDKRMDNYSVIREMTTEQLHTYTPDQLVKLLEQRENVWTKAEQDKRAQQPPRTLADFAAGVPRNIVNFPSQLTGGGPWNSNAPNDRPWVPPRHDECKFMVCSACYRAAKDKSWVSLDGIVEGDIPPTVATAYSFVYMKERPVCIAEVVGRLGYRAVPLPRHHLARRHSDPIIIGVRNIHLQPDSLRMPVIPVIEYKPGDEYDPDADTDWETIPDDASDESLSGSYISSGGTVHMLPQGRTLRRSPPLTTLRALLNPPDGGQAWNETRTVDVIEPTPLPPVETLPAGVVANLQGEDLRAYHGAFYFSMDWALELAAQVELPEADIDEELWMLDEAFGSMDYAEEGGDDGQFGYAYHVENHDDEQRFADQSPGGQPAAGHPSGPHDSGSQRFGSEPPHGAGGIAVREESKEGGLADLVTQL
ncbi:hypothetical protein GE09DRAFT_1055628 [Coniochaeta sp. 2T2.1]|nr:hypothetical protein GE09DRAFT_1055628 [Coniochaeta sp. 2T2.1]